MQFYDKHKSSVHKMYELTIYVYHEISFARYLDEHEWVIYRLENVLILLNIRTSGL